MSGKRIFDRFGFNLPKRDAASKAKLLTEYDRWTFQPGCADWVNAETGEMLISYQITNELKEILAHRIDTILD